MECPKCGESTVTRNYADHCVSCRSNVNQVECVACGVKYYELVGYGVWHDHHCDPKKLANRDRVLSSNRDYQGRSEAQRLREGLRMMEQEGE